ncbi:MAG: hypothetical protein ABSF38_12130 [Verrucomicrobiota bacterium]|jgi:hypothetical protein
MRLKVATMVAAMALGIAWIGSAQMICPQYFDAAGQAVPATSGPASPVALALVLPGWAVTADGAEQATPTVANGAVRRNNIPEPTTIIAGMLLLLPFAASALRILRKRRKAA